MVDFFRRIFKQSNKQARITTNRVETNAVSDRDALSNQNAENARIWEDTLDGRISTMSEKREEKFEKTILAGAPDKGRQKPTYQVGFATHVGRVRKRNEDSALIITSASLGDSLLPPFGLFCVADGMGGHSDGQKASQIAVRVLAREVIGQLYTPYLQLDSNEPNKPVQNILGDAVQKANWHVHTANSESGTTLTAILIIGKRLFAAHVGDSRAYLFHEEEKSGELMTVDHSFVQRLQDAGQITSEEAAVHPQRNILYRAIGQGEQLDIDTFSRVLPLPCWLFLCSDGLWGEVNAESIQRTIQESAEPQDACDQLIDAAYQAGGPDNITAILVRLKDS